MGRILAIDYGTKRTGIAVTDPLQIIANALTTVRTHELIPFLKNYMVNEKVDIIVIGEPKQMNNTPSESVNMIEAFIKHLKRTFPDIIIDRMDERFTSKIAFQSMLDAGLKKKDRQNKELVDAISATIILQSYMDLKSR
jgi:putative Holliday junction resolvase